MAERVVKRRKRELAVTVPDALYVLEERLMAVSNELHDITVKIGIIADFFKDKEGK